MSKHPTAIHSLEALAARSPDLPTDDERVDAVLASHPDWASASPEMRALGVRRVLAALRDGPVLDLDPLALLRSKRAAPRERFRPGIEPVRPDLAPRDAMPVRTVPAADDLADPDVAQPAVDVADERAMDVSQTLLTTDGSATP